MFSGRKVIPQLFLSTFQQSTNVSTHNVPFLKIPGPKRIPFIGMLNDVMHLGKPAELHQRISKYHDTYGDIFRLQIGAQQAVFLRDPDLMRKTFQVEGTFPKHPLPESWTYFNKKFGYQRGLFFMDGKDWLQARQIFNKPLLKDFIWMEPPIRNVCEAKVVDIEKMSDQHTAFEGIESFLYKWSVEVVLSVMLGKSFEQCQASSEFRELVQQFSRVVYDIFKHSAELMNIPPTIADRLNVQAWQQFERVVPETIRLASEIIEFGIQHKHSNDGLLDLMTQKLEKSLMMRIFIDFIIAAGDTTAFATVWALHLLASDRKVQERVRQNVNDSNSLECTAIKGVVRETLRLYPVAPFVGRFIENDTVFDNYTVPKDTLVLLSLYSSGRDERFFSDPEQFNPYRWDRSIAKTSSSTTTAAASLPFALGARSCIGQKIAQLQMHYLLSMILTKFDMSIPEKQRQQQIKPILKMITVPNMPVQVIFKSI
uniref:Cytochrome P450 n=1 Tax=Anopheles atroparvus TaxID=41427 RepID=A0AAG5DX31_ANOAO